MLHEVLTALPPQYRRGGLKYITGFVWWCEDEVCDCTQAVIEAVFEHRESPGWIWRDVLWRGTFFGGGEPGAVDDLRQAHQYLEALTPSAAKEVASNVWRLEL